MKSSNAMDSSHSDTCRGNELSMEGESDNTDVVRPKNKVLDVHIDFDLFKYPWRHAEGVKCEICR